MSRAIGIFFVSVLVALTTQARGFTRAFVSSVDYQGNLSGLAGADAACTTLANDAGLSGTWIALLSTSTKSAKSRLAGITKVVNMKGEIVFNKDWNKIGIKEPPFDSLDGSSNFIKNKINYDQGGNLVGTGTVWTGTSATGAAAATTCSNWTVSSNASSGTRGQLNDTTSGYLDTTAPATCNIYHKIYCLEKP